MGTGIGFIPTKPRAVYYDTFANLPVANVLTGDLAWATDREVFYRWSGVAWVFVSISSRSGALGDIGVAANYPPGSLYQDTGGDELYMLIGGAWVKIVAAIPSPVVSTVRKTADQTVNNSTVLVDDTHLVFAVAANDVWDIYCHLRANAPGAAAFKMAWTIPAGGALRNGDRYDIANTYRALEGQDMTVEKFISFGGAGWTVNFRGVYVGGANAGNLQLRWAQNVAAAVDTTVRVSSFMICHKIS